MHHLSRAAFSLGWRAPCKSRCFLAGVACNVSFHRHHRHRRCCRSDLLGGWLPCPLACSCCSPCRVKPAAALSVAISAFAAAAAATCSVAGCLAPRRARAELTPRALLGNISWPCCHRPRCRQFGDGAALARWPSPATTSGSVSHTCAGITLSFVPRLHLGCWPNGPVGSLAAPCPRMRLVRLGLAAMIMGDVS